MGKPKPSYAPLYAAALYPELCLIFRRHGYALAVHGSLARDFDLVAIPWTEEVSAPDDVLREVMEVFAVKIIGAPELKPHGRLAYTLSVGFGECAADVSFMPVGGCYVASA